jgi:lipopolysaccharide/colanic/teichoic acid biosynthesis glycosyltransferase
LLAPVLIGVAAAVRATSSGPSLYRAQRVGRGRIFTCLKFRTMRVTRDDMAGIAVTAAGDPRVTPIGRWLRRTKVDELPQLWNVVRGEMLLVGPRPEDPTYVDWARPEHAEVFGARPGITGPTAIAFADEERMLADEAANIARAAGRSQPTASDIEAAYRDRLLPLKVASDLEYLTSRTVRGDLRFIGMTLGVMLRRGG